MKIKYSYPILLFVLSFLVLSCSNEEEVLAKKEKEAEKILEKADNLLNMGKELDALKTYDSLAKEFPETNARETAEKKLRKQGLSIGSSLISWTSQRMFKLENTIIAYRDSKGVYPSGHEIKQPKDAWGNQIYYKFYPDKKEYDFLVLSNGPDGIKKTEDDIIIVHSRGKNEAVANKIPRSGQEGISLDQLKDLADSQGGESSGKSTISLEQLSEIAKSKGSGEMELSLDELKNLSENR